jgi:chromosome segregation ATPase
MNDCEFYKIAFQSTLSSFNEAKAEGDTVARRIQEVNGRIETSNQSIVRAEDELYYLNQDIQNLGRDRDGLVNDQSRKKSELDRLNWDPTDENKSQRDKLEWDIRDLDYKIGDFNSQISSKRSDQQSKASALERNKHARDGEVNELSTQRSNLTQAQQKKDGIKRALETALQNVTQSCGNSQGLSIPWD